MYDAGQSGGLGPHPGPGDRVGGYLIASTVGAGGMASVYRAEDGEGRTVALKILNPARVLPEDVKRFTREYRALARMDHPNVVRVHDAGVHQGYPWIAMELVDGIDLGTLIERWSADPPPDRFDRIVRALRGMCRGLQYVHDLGLVHRDIKPSNVLVTRDGEAKLSDFGVVKGGDHTHVTQLTMAGRLVGTVAFMAPELITDEGVDRRADLYALGACLYIMLTFRRPIEADSVAGYLARHLTEVPRPAGELDPDVPTRLEAICQRLLLKDKTYRYPTAQAVLAALDRPDGPETPPLRGRDRALAHWSRALGALERGAGGLIALSGPPGSGRSHLLQALVEQAHSTGIRAVRARAGAGDPVQALIAGLGAEGEGDVGLIEAIGDRALVLAVDDLERATRGAIDALGRVMRRLVSIEGRPVLLVYSATDLEDRLAALAAGQTTGLASEVIGVGPLDARSIVAMMRDRGVAGPAAPMLGRRMFEEYGGMPGATVDQLEALVAQGWFERLGEALKPARPLDAFRRAELPVPAGVREGIERKLKGLDAGAREVVELLALLDRPAASALLERCSSDPMRMPRRLDALVRHEVLLRTTVDAKELLRLAHPCAARVVRNGLSEQRARERHAAIATALGARRRRANALEVGRHKQAAGDAAGALPLYVQAARRAARAGLFGEVLDITDRAASIREEAEATLPVAEALKLRRRVAMLRGEALLARGAWDDAVAPLDDAVVAARASGDTAALARCLGSLGRAHYRASRFDQAAPLLHEALEHADASAPERASATRALADIELRAGRVQSSERLWATALELAIELGSSDAEARARRGLAHCRAIQGRLQHASDLLTQAEEMLHSEGDARVRAGMMARCIELDNAAGRYAAALYRAELLVDLARRRDMSQRLPEAYALLAETLRCVGAHDDALDAAHQALVFAKAHGASAWRARLWAARVLCDLERWSDLPGALPELEHLPASRVDDPAAQLAAIRARGFALDNPARARDLATWAIVREPPLLNIRGGSIALDAAEALRTSGHPVAARNAVKRGLKILQAPAADGLRLELLVAMQRAAPDPRVLDAAGQVAARVLAGLSGQAAASFRTREVIERALANQAKTR